MMTPIRWVGGLGVLLAIYAAGPNLVPTAPAAGNPPFEIATVSPEGTVKDVRQVRVTFSEPVVAFGDARTGSKDGPFDIHCPEKGSGRWADAKTWIYDFEHDLP